ncbi:PREDICTED: cadherin EGF LAG seven-pass G-type receptor 2-like, partial [Priapulus caudatus]|uniref:Cadherin EGF LAG seven-pass G-type receptor 2-like n=1 Tax=Priapulus caudatus TaxID=37621 RepID=A0ABM1F5P8_PRICU
MENGRAGERVATVTASDGDAGDNARIFYHVVGGNGASVFSVDAATGDVVARRPLDREEASSYDLVVAATNDASWRPAAAAAAGETYDRDDVTRAGDASDDGGHAGYHGYGIRRGCWRRMRWRAIAYSIAEQSYSRNKQLH